MCFSMTNPMYFCSFPSFGLLALLTTHNVTFIGYSTENARSWFWGGLLNDHRRHRDSAHPIESMGKRKVHQACSCSCMYTQNKLRDFGGILTIAQPDASWLWGHQRIIFDSGAGVAFTNWVKMLGSHVFRVKAIFGVGLFYLVY